MQNAGRCLFILTTCYLGEAFESATREQLEGNVEKETSSQQAHVMRRNDAKWRSMPEVTVFSVDADAHLRQENLKVAPAPSPHDSRQGPTLHHKEAEVHHHVEDRHRHHDGSEHQDKNGPMRQAPPTRGQLPHAGHIQSHGHSEGIQSQTAQHAPRVHHQQPAPSPSSRAGVEGSKQSAPAQPHQPSPGHQSHHKPSSQHVDELHRNLPARHTHQDAERPARSWEEDGRQQARETLRNSRPPVVMSQRDEDGRAIRSSSPAPGSESEGNVVAGRKTISLATVAVAQSKIFAEQLIAEERESLCPQLPSRVSLEILAANAKIAEELTFVFRAKLTTEDRKIPNQAAKMLRTGIEVEWKENTAGTTNDEQAALARAEDELLEKNSLWDPISRGAKLILPLSACDLMNETFSLMCNRKRKPHADGSSASLSEQGSSLGEEMQVEASLRQLRELYLSLPGGLGVVVDREKEAYADGLRRQELQAARDPRRKPSLLQRAGGDTTSFPATFSWLYERPQCLDYVHHQGTCGACYMFAALDSLSDRHCIDSTNASRLGKVDHLSVQMALLCEPLGRQCAGGWADVGFNYSVYFGLHTATKWPYERSCLSDSECQFGKQCFSPSSYGCPSFFSQEELDEISTFSDALRVTKRKCETSHIEDPDNCKVWAETMFAMSPTMVFMPESCFCAELVADWATFGAKPVPCHSSGGDGSGIPTILLEAKTSHRDEDEDEDNGFNFFEWLASLFFGSSQEQTSQESSTTWNANIPGGSWSSGSKSVSSVTLTTTTVEQCSRDRCLLEPKPHKATRYHYIVNQKAWQFLVCSGCMRCARMSSRWRSTMTARSTQVTTSTRILRGSSSSGLKMATIISGVPCRVGMPLSSSAGKAASITGTRSPFQEIQTRCRKTVVPATARKALASVGTCGIPGATSGVTRGTSAC
ncbi:unnamed protein product [Symbiodinium natans]|uniref:Peptidase C1A papain C-terminal domain-containing protein n=1 Tax=Symbiodinium natans TaxID=878477 RepID=A0A812T2M2_9DINO|nr:unnamed protein product [Symbiodinium natans]